VSDARMPIAGSRMHRQRANRVAPLPGSLKMRDALLGASAADCGAIVFLPQLRGWRNLDAD
jgi:hypothetical protein